MDALAAQSRLPGRARHGSTTAVVAASGARVVRDEAWVEANLVTESLPILGEARCHRVLMHAVRGALQQLLDAGLAHLKGLKSLSNLRLTSPQLTDDGFKHICELPNLKILFAKKHILCN